MDIAAWLREIGLDHYERAFLDNAIDADVLPTLTADDLKDLGVSAVGHRRRLLNAIATLREPEPTAGDEPVAERRAGAERRQLTVMLCDLVGSTELARRLDPEELGGIMRAYQDAVAGEVARLEGHVAKFMGDGVLAYFGWPRAHEDEAERAVRAALAIRDAVGRLATPASLAVRIGIATGLVMVGDLIGEGAAQEQAVVGETPNLAARLQALAEPGTVVIAERTRRLLGGLFELADLGARLLKGFPEPVEAWQVIGLSAAESRFEAMHASSLTPLVGREHELGLLFDRWALAQGGEGQVVFLSGEAGIGKSRIVQALLNRLGDGSYTRLRYYCSPYHTNSALHPVIEQLKRAAGFAPDDNTDVRLDKLEALLGQASARAVEVAPLLAALLSIPGVGRYPPLNFTPQAQKARTLEALVGQLEGLAEKHSVLVIFEDAHWIDPTTTELFELVIERVQRLPVLLLITFRPEFTPPWAGHAHITTLTLNRLGRSQGAAIIARLSGKALPADVLSQILEKTDGVPLFLEELTKTVLESGVLRDVGERYELSGPLPPLAIPNTLHDSLMARLDRLARVKEVAQIGAAIGREFSHALLAAVAERPEPELHAALDQLVGAQLIFRRGTPPEASYSFKHALVQDAAYGTLLKSRRQALHARIAQVLEDRFPETAESRPELLAHHFTQAGLTEQALAYWHTAGLWAMARSAYSEAIAQLTRGLDLVSSLPDGPERRQRELDLQVALGGARIAATGWAADETGATYARARELCHQVKGSPQLVPVLWGLFQFHNNRAELRKAWAIAQEFVRVAEERPQDYAAVVISHRVTGINLQMRGRPTPAFAHHEKAFALYDPSERRSSVFFAAVDTRVHSLGFTAWILLHQGYPDQALARIRQALALTDELGHPYTSAYALHLTCGFHQFRREWSALAAKAAMQMSVASEHGFPHWLATGTIFHGCGAAAGGELEAGIAEIHQGLSAMQTTGAQMKVPYYLALLAGAYMSAGHAREALELLAEALVRMDAAEEHWFEAELYRLRGEVLLRSGLAEVEQAEASFRRAIEAAQSQCTRWWELRAATSLARLWAEQGLRTEAHDLLAPVYCWFTEGFDTADLKAAKALLDELA